MSTQELIFNWTFKHMINPPTLICGCFVKVILMSHNLLVAILTAKKASLKPAMRSFILFNRIQKDIININGTVYSNIVR